MTARDDVAAHATTLSALVANYDQAMLDLQDAETSLNDAQADLDAALLAVQAKDTALQATTVELTARTAELQAKSAELVDALALVGQRDSTIAQLQAEIMSLNGRITQLEAVIAGLRAQLSPSGEPMPITDLPGWKLSFTDDFDVDVALGTWFTSPMVNKWHAYKPPADDTSNHGIYDPVRVVSVSGGVLRKHLHTADGMPRVAALMPKNADGTIGGQLYGRSSIRARVPQPIPGYKVAWLWWPAGGRPWPHNGEIDFPEMSLDSTRLGGFIHHWGATVGSDQKTFALDNHDLSKWHTYTIEWSPNLIVFILDGVELLRYTTRIPQDVMRLVIQTETNISSTIPSPSVAGDVEIDWVALWTRSVPA
jgi:hypothetical protein